MVAHVLFQPFSNINMSIVCKCDQDGECALRMINKLRRQLGITLLRSAEHDGKGLFHNTQTRATFNHSTAAASRLIAMPFVAEGKNTEVC